MDSYWGGKNDLIAAVGFEKDGVTTIAFRKKLKATEPTDHSIVDEVMHVIWAKGQEQKNYQHSPKSGLEKDVAFVKDFYKQDELKYNGHGSQRGVISINFFDEPGKQTSSIDDQESEKTADDSLTSRNKPSVQQVSTPAPSNCYGQWATPKGCNVTAGQCEYHVVWTYSSKTDYMRFTITTTHTSTWTGIGFSDDHKMSQTDAIIGWVDKAGRPFLMDTWINGYTAPLLDASQDLSNITGNTAEGLTTLSFMRKRSTGDTKDMMFADDKCLYLTFIVKGGGYNPVNKKIKKHEALPMFSNDRVCIRSCGAEEDWELATTTTAPKAAYNVAIKLVKLGENFVVPPAGSPDFDALANTVTSGFKKTLTKLPEFYKISVDEFSQDNDNVVAKMSVELDESGGGSRGRALGTDEGAEQLERVLRSTVNSGHVGALSLDPKYFVFEAAPLSSTIPLEENVNDSILLSTTKLWIVIGCISALVFIAIVQAGCTIYKTARRPRPNHKDHGGVNSAWKDYSSGGGGPNTNYAFDQYDGDEKQSPSSLSHTSTIPLTTKLVSHNGGGGGNHYAESRSLHRPSANTAAAANGGRHMHSRPPPPPAHQQQLLHQDRAAGTYSLPRPAQQPPHHNGGYYTHRPPNRTAHHGPPHQQQSAGGDQLQPDFYFMPSQRKYSGEVVRVYVDYNTNPRK